MIRFFFLVIAVSLHAQPGPARQVPESLRSRTWSEHFAQQILPFWVQPAALGVPTGWYPMVRDRAGAPVEGRTDRRPRMLGRQIYVYSMGFLLTGRSELLEYAAAGVRFLIDRGWDREFGGWHEVLNGDGTSRRGPKWAQDMAYVALGLAAWYFVTRDPEAEEYLEKTRTLVMDPQRFWDAEAGTVHDGLSHDLSRPLDQEGGGKELVAVLDQLNAYMVLVQPLLPSESQRRAWATDMERLAEALMAHFYRDGVFYGQSARRGQLRSRHTDLGHTIKAFAMTRLVGRLIGRADWMEFADQEGIPWIAAGQDPETGLWGGGLSAPYRVQRGSQWWQYAEMDQYTAEVNLRRGGALTPILERAARGWLERYTDNEFGEVFSSVDASGVVETRGFKAWDWKNGYHSTEHALMLYLHGTALEGIEAELWFALPPQQASGATLTPYWLEGRLVSRQIGERLRVAARELVRVRTRWKIGG